MKFFKNIFSFFRNLLSKKEPVKMLEVAQSNNVSKEKTPLKEILFPSNNNPNPLNLWPNNFKCYIIRIRNASYI